MAEAATSMPYWFTESKGKEYNIIIDNCSIADRAN